MRLKGMYLQVINIIMGGFDFDRFLYGEGLPPSIFCRWEVSASDDLPEYMQVCFFALLDVVNEIEERLTDEGRSYRVYYAKEAVSFGFYHFCFIFMLSSIYN